MKNLIYLIKYIWEEIMWIFDFYFAWMFYNGYKLHRYHSYMIKKWGDRYTSLFRKK